MRRLAWKRYLQWTTYVWANHRDRMYPLYASFKLTHRCRFRCPFCNVWMEEVPEVPAKEAFRILDNLGRSSVFLLTIEGGEPLLREDVGEILWYAHQKPFYLLLVTSERGLADYPMKDYCRYIDFLHISIDEGHRNLELLDQLETFAGWGSDVCVQVVVRDQDLHALDYKVHRCHQAGVKILPMPAVHLDQTENYFPEVEAFVQRCIQLKRAYRNTIIAPEGYLKRLQSNGPFTSFYTPGCSASSVIIDSDGGLFYPCRTLGEKRVNLLEVDLMDFIASKEAAARREVMRTCTHRCGWYQYFATDVFSSLPEFWEAAQPYLRNMFAL